MKRDENKKYFPTMVDGSNFEIFQKINTLPKKTHDILLSDAIVDFVYGIEQRFHLQDSATEEFSRNVRQYFFREITEQGFAQKISQLCRISPEDAMKILRAIVSIDPEDVENASREVKKNIVAIPLNEALSKYPKIKEQKITSRSITTRPFLQPLKPTVKNWIMVYEKVLDVSRHNAIERGEFVFRSEATRGLSEEERHILATLFKSRDEGTKIAIDVNTNEIDFSVDGESITNDLRSTQKPLLVTSDLSSQQNVRQNSVSRASITIPYAEQYEKRNVRDELITQKKIQHPPTAQNTSQKNTSPNDPRRNPAFAALQEEIIKNRAEMNTFGSEAVLPTPIKTVEQRPIKTVEQKKDSEETNISFSSKHTLPVEKEKETQKTSTQNHLSMSPIGFAHTLPTQKNEKKKTV